jgi:hypothetical protein
MSYSSSEFSGSGSSASFHAPSSETSSLASSSGEYTQIEMSSSIYMESNSLEDGSLEDTNDEIVSIFKAILTYLLFLATAWNCRQIGSK